MSTILIVDDEPAGRMVLDGILQADGYNLAFASNGIEAMEQASILTPDLILLDVMMPGLDGFEVCQRLRATPRLAEVPILLVTALDDRDSRLRGIEVGADDFISKPIDRVEMRARVRTIARLNRYRHLMNERMKFERVVEFLPNGILIINAKGLIMLTNPAMQHLVGLPDTASMADRQVESFLLPEQWAQCQAMLHSVVADPAYVGRLEAMWVRLDGTHFPAEVDIGHIEWEGQPAVQFIVRDITWRKQAEEELSSAYADLVELNQQLARSRDVLRALLDGMDNGLALINSSGNVLALNQALSTLIGAQPEVFAYYPWKWLCQVSEPPFPGELVLQSLDDGLAHTGRVRYLDRKQQHRILDIRTLPLPDTGSSVELLIVHIVDVTEQVQLEAMALENERFAANGKLAATVAHEVNTPLHTIKTSLYLAGKAGEEKRATYLVLAQEEIDRVSHILRQLLDLYRSTEGAVVEIDTNALIDRMLLLTGSTLAKQGIQVHNDLPPDLPVFWGHAEQITQVLLNLILNAVVCGGVLLH
jgi:PAS domain S-box-containing protein